MTPRSVAQRTIDVLALLATEVDLWVASADANGGAYLIPLSFFWDQTSLFLATLARSRTARDLERAGVARVALGTTRDVVIVEGTVALIALPGIDPRLAEAHARHTGFDPRREREPYVYLRVTPRTIQAWRTAAELSDRVVMRAGQWLAPPAPITDRRLDT